jgi:hypothetical protein
MRSFRLARLAAEAEALRWRAFAERTARRAGFAAIAGIFLILALAGLHAAAAIMMVSYVSPLATSLILVAADIVIGCVFLLLASRDTQSTAERDALQLRRSAIDGIKQEASMASLVASVIAMLSRRSQK